MKYRVRLNKVAGGICLAVGAFCAQSGFAQVNTTYKEQGNILTNIEENEPDLTGLWFHINEGQTQLANAEAARLKQTYPRWVMPEALADALARMNDTTKLASDVPVPEKDAPLRRFAALNEDQRRDVENRRFTRLSDLTFQLARADYHLLMGWSALDRRNYALAEKHFLRVKALSPDVITTKAANEGLYAIIDSQVVDAIDSGAYDRLTTLLQQDDTGRVQAGIEGQAWQFYEENDDVTAERLFSLTGNQEGIWLVLQKHKGVFDAGEYACEQAHNEVFLRRCADYLSYRQSSQFNEGNYASSIDAAQNLATLRPLRYEEQALVGWAAISINRDTLAIEAFEEALRLSPKDNDIAQQLVNLYAARGQSVQPLAKTYPSIQNILNTRVASRAWPRKQFMLSYFANNTRSVEAQSKDALSLLAGLRAKQRSGDAGLGNFDKTVHYIALEDTYQQWRWQVSLDYQTLYSGAADADSWFASGQLNDTFSGITGFEDAGIRAEVDVEREWGNLYSSIAYALWDQPVNTKLTGQVSATWFFSNATLATRVHRLPVEDSLLSYTGTFNNTRDESWGYVIGEGASALFAYTFKPQVSFAATIKLENLKGEQVKDNQSLYLRGDISTNIAPNVSDRLDYWRVGPYLSYLGFDENLSGFTYGHGGYFSPNYLVSLGGYSELLTMEAHRWQLKISTAVGLSKVNESAYSRFPLSDNDTQKSIMASSSNSTGLSGNLKVEGQYRLSNHWIAAGYVGKAFAVQYQAFEFGFQIRWRPGKGSGVTSDELMGSSPWISGFAL